MYFHLPVLLLGGQLMLPVADTLPDFDVSISCRGVNQTATSQRDMGSCFEQERAARDEINKEWALFAPRDRTVCVHSTSTGGIPSYVELLTCLEMARDVKNLPSSTTGSGGSER